MLGIIKNYLNHINGKYRMKGRVYLNVNNLEKKKKENVLLIVQQFFNYLTSKTGEF